MKFLVIGKPISPDHSVSSSSESANSHASTLRSMVDGPVLEKAYILISGGFALVVNANDTVELATIVRSNPFFKTCTVDIIPIADAHDYLEVAAQRI